MGCTSSKRIEATVDVYRPPPSSFAVFDINCIQEPWLVVDNINTIQEHQEKPTNVPAPILEKLKTFETDAPRSWDEVSKALQDLKPTLNTKNPTTATSPKASTPNRPAPVSTTITTTNKEGPLKSFSFHTLEELDAKRTSKPEKELKGTESTQTQLKKQRVSITKTESRVGVDESATESTGNGGVIIKPVKENIFIVRDRLERQKEGKMANYDKLTKLKRDPLSDYPEKCPPDGADSVVLYTTSLRGVRRTHEDCSRVRDILELHGVVLDERDVSLHGEFLNELRGLLGEEVSVPRVFVKGRYIGGVEELVELDELGRLGRILSWARVERCGLGRQACEGCGGARFVPCFDCRGSCKVLVNGVKERCGKCNENGLVRCPVCP